MLILYWLEGLLHWRRQLLLWVSGAPTHSLCEFRRIKNLKKKVPNDASPSYLWGFLTCLYRLVVLHMCLKCPFHFGSRLVHTKQSKYFGGVGKETWVDNLVAFYTMLQFKDWGCHVSMGSTMYHVFQ